MLDTCEAPSGLQKETVGPLSPSAGIITTRLSPDAYLDYAIADYSEAREIFVGHRLEHHSATVAAHFDYAIELKRLLLLQKSDKH